MPSVTDLRFQFALPPPALPPAPGGSHQPPLPRSPASHRSVSSQSPLGLQPPIRSPTVEARSPAAAPPAPAARSPAAAAPKRRPVPSVSSSRNSISAPESPGTRSTLGFGFRLGLQA
ncbi:lysine-rich arabinogalactan protein 19-like [Capsicum annuum]|uniref:lysine-rich arabinogalactan protein 19-like n=1 Tax=Capsicum annuum TaxID=4072 RepID=UPI001FB19D64|nr:lysine-rich arabinogalactan protein 19-like [Capsicum annuum]